MSDFSENIAFYAMAYQAPCHAVNACPDRAAAQARMKATLDDLAGKLRASKLFVGPDVRLIVLPEYFLTSYPVGETIESWRNKAAIHMDGPEYEALGQIAQDNDTYLSGNAYEIDPHFPELYFQTSFIIAPTAEVILRYRRLNSMFAPTPHDVWDKYLDIYGLEGVFPVVDTPIGRLACVASEEILYPEISRALALRGAEILCHSSSEIGSPTETPKQIARRARAMENMAWVVSANSAGIYDSGFPVSGTDGNSAIVNPKGHLIAQSNTGETMTAHGEIDITALRRARRRPGMMNLRARQRLAAFAEIYADETLGQPANSLLAPHGGIVVPDRSHFTNVQRSTIQKLIDDDLI